MNQNIDAVKYWMSQWSENTKPVQALWAYLTLPENSDLVTRLAEVPYHHYEMLPLVMEAPEQPLPFTSPLFTSPARAHMNARRVSSYRFWLRLARKNNSQLVMPIEATERLNALIDRVDRELNAGMTGAYAAWLFERIIILSRAACGLEIPGARP